MSRAYHRRRTYPQPHLQKAKQANALRKMAERFDAKAAERQRQKSPPVEPEGEQ
jgi:hypothetical protein